MWTGLNPILPGGKVGGGGGRNTPPSCFSSTILKRLKASSWNFLTLKIHLEDTFCRSNQFVKFWVAAMAEKLKKVPRRIWLQRKVKNQPFVKILSWNSFSIETKFGPLSLKTNKFAIWRHHDVFSFQAFSSWNTEMASSWRHTSKFSKFYNWNQKMIPGRLYIPNFMLQGEKNKRIRRGKIRPPPRVWLVFKSPDKIGLRQSLYFLLNPTIESRLCIFPK